MSDVLNETIKSLLGESAPKTTNEDAIRSTINNNEFLNFLNVTPSEILDQVKIAEKDYKDLVKYISEYKGDFGSLYNELGGWNLQDEDTTQIVDNLFDCYYGCLLVTIKVNYGKLSVSPTDVYVYPSNITMVDSDELFHLDMGVPIDYSKFTDIIPENNTVKEEANNIQEAKNEDLGEVVKVFKSDDGLAVKIIKAPNGKFFNEYYSDINDAHYSGTSGPFKSVKDAEKMVHKHRPTVKEINITESEEVSKEGKSCRYAINESATVVKEDPEISNPDFRWLDQDTFIMEFGYNKDGDDTYDYIVEYWKDDDTFHFLKVYEYDTIPVEFPEAKTNEIKDMMRAKMDNKESKVQESVDINSNLKDMSDEDLDALLLDTIDEREGVDDDSERAEELDNFYMELDSEIRSRQNCKSARCIKSYDEDGDEYWSEGNYYTVCQLDNDTWTVRNNFDGVSKIGPDYTVDDFDEYFVLEEAKVIKQPKSEEEKTYEMVKHNYGKKAADEWYQFNKCAGDTVKKYVKAKAEEAKKLREAKRTVGDILDEIEEAESIGDIIEICENMKDEVNKGVIRNEIDAIYIDYPDADDIDSDDYDEALENLKNCIIDDFDCERDSLDESKNKYDENKEIKESKIVNESENVKDIKNEVLANETLRIINALYPEAQQGSSEFYNGIIMYNTEDIGSNNGLLKIRDIMTTKLRFEESDTNTYRYTENNINIDTDGKYHYKEFSYQIVVRFEILDGKDFIKGFVTLNDFKCNDVEKIEGKPMSNPVKDPIPKENGKLTEDTSGQEVVQIMAYGKVYYEFDVNEWNMMSEEEQNATLIDTADQATEEEGHIVDVDEVEISTTLCSQHNDDLNESKKVKTEAPEQDNDEYIRLCTEIEFQAEDNGFTLTNDDVKAIADKMIEDKFFFTHDIFANDDDEDAWGEINDLIVNAIESYPNKVEESKNKILDDIGEKIEI